ncbi:MAG: hypothetical protein EXS35_04995 [Pedosphaera sp.]|nr:hypothetical protein [Pedosphaera sp.]
MSENNQNDGIQTQINLILGALIILTATVAAYLYVQARHLRADVNAFRPTHAAVIQGYNNEKPAVDAFLAKLVDYGKTHPDFAPIMKKYQLQPGTNAVAPASAAKPAASAVKPAAPAAPAPAKAAPATAPKK